MLRELRERIPDPNVYRVYLTTFTLGVAYGIAISVLAVYLDQKGFEKAAIGQLAAWFAAGIVTLSVPMGFLIQKLSAKTTLVISLFGYALTVSVFPLLDGYSSIAILRFFDGACSVGVWVSSETILLSRARPQHKALTTSLYAIAIAVGYVVGPLTARLCVAILPLQLAFWVSGGIAVLAGTYAATRLSGNSSTAAAAQQPGPVEPTAPRGSSLALLWRIKTSCFATFAYGYFQASVVLFLPLYLIASKGIARDQTIVIPAFFAGGMLAFSSLAGRLGDRVGHLLVMRVLGSIGFSMILAFVFFDSYFWMCAAVTVAGASLGSISPVSLALQGVISTEYSRATALYNAFYAAGMLLGPPASSLLFQARGGGPMLYHLAALWIAFVLFTLLFRRDDPAARPVLVEENLRNSESF